MIFGFGTFVLGYAVFYWGLHHFSGVDCPTGNNCRYSMWQVLGFGIVKDGATQQGTLFKNTIMSAGKPIQWKSATTP